MGSSLVSSAAAQLRIGVVVVSAFVLGLGERNWATRLRPARRPRLPRSPVFVTGVLAATLLILFLRPVDAGAGSYVVHACRLPTGAPAPALGWRAQGEANVVLANSCLGGGSLSIGFRAGALPSTQWTGSWGEWIFDTPPDTRITAYSVYRHVRVHLGSAALPVASEYKQYWDDWWAFPVSDLCNPNVCQQLGLNPGVPRDPANLFQVAGVDTGRLTFHLMCWRSDGGHDCPSWWQPILLIYAADLTLSDPHVPAIVGVAGDLSGRLYGTPTVAVRAVDRGGGLHRVQLLVDGVLVRDQSFSRSSPSCVEPFVHPVPCPLSGEARVPLDTSRLLDGLHQLQVSVLDAAGNRASSETYSIEVDNAGATCAYGAGASLQARFRSSGKARLRARADRRVAVVGRLRAPNGKGIDGALLRLYVKARNRTRYHQLRVITVGKNGRFRFSLRAGSTRRVRLSYCAPGGGAHRLLHLKASASSSIRATPRVLRNGQMMLLRGRLRGGDVPETGKLLEIQAFFRDRWRTISSVRSDRRGEWRFRYRFDGTQGRVTYQFRAQVPIEAGYPFESGSSRTIRVTVVGP
jgi:hypothetical protein